MNPTAPAWLLGSRHAVTTKVKLVLWEVQNLAEAELKQDGRDLRDSRRLRVLGWGNGSYVPSVVPSNPPSILVTLAGRGPTPASSLLDGLLNDGEWNLPPVVALVNRTRTGFVQGRWSTPDEQRHLRIGGVGIVSERAYFGIYDNQSLEELPVNPIQPTGVVGRQRPKLDAAWFDGASIINPDFKPLGWIEREASVPDIKVQDDRRGTGSPQ